MEQRPNFLTNRGNSYQFKGELGTALSDYDAALKLDPNFALAYNNRAVLYKKMGERAKALADYEAALRLDPGNENAINGRRTMKAEIARFGSPGAAPAECEFRSPLRRSIAMTPACGRAGDLRRSAVGPLDRQIFEAYEVDETIAGRTADALRRAQRDFIAGRNAGYGRPGYDLHMVMQDRCSG